MAGLAMIVSNSTPLINFAAIDRLDILENLFTTLTIPPAVQHELLERGAEYPHMTIIRRATFIDEREIHNEMLRTALTIDLDPGEAEAIILALEHKADLLLLDEIAARMIAGDAGCPWGRWASRAAPTMTIPMTPTTCAVTGHAPVETWIRER